MPVNIDRLKGREVEFNNKYHTNFSYEDFLDTVEEIGFPDPDSIEEVENPANVVYRFALANVLQEAMLHTCNSERMSENGKTYSVDLYAVLDEFEYFLMQPFAHECKQGHDPIAPKPYGGMKDSDKIAIVENIVNSSPKNDVELTEQAYKSGQIRIRDMREYVNGIDFTKHNSNMELSVSVSEMELKRIATCMLALENVNKSRSFWWKVFHPIRNNAEKREAGEMKTLLKSFGGNALEHAKELANREYGTLTATKEGLDNAKAELERRNNMSETEKFNEYIRSIGGTVYESKAEQKIVITYKNANQKSDEKAPIKVDLGNNPNNDVSDKVENKEIKQPVNVKNI